MEENENKEITNIDLKNNNSRNFSPAIKFFIRLLVSIIVIFVAAYLMVGMLIGLGLGGGPHGWSGNENNLFAYFIAVGVPLIVIFIAFWWCFASFLDLIFSFFNFKDGIQRTIKKCAELIYLFLIGLVSLFLGILILLL